MISIYYNNGRNCLHLRKCDTRKIFYDKWHNFIPGEMGLKGSHEKICTRFTQFAQYKPKLMGFIYHL